VIKKNKKTRGMVNYGNVLCSLDPTFNSYFFATTDIIPGVIQGIDVEDPDW
jgi:hypothetical protein